MEQYKHKVTERKLKIDTVDPTMREQAAIIENLSRHVQTLMSTVEYQSRQIRRLESSIQVLESRVVR